MSALNRDARDTIKASGMTIAAYVRDRSDDGRWHGDACGCPDDRCAGFHHDDQDDCPCLGATLRQLGAAVPSWLT